MRLASTVVLATLAAAPLRGQTFDFHDRGPYRPQVPRPDSLLGHAAGERHTMYHQQQQVLGAMVAAAPDRVRTETIGRTVEGKVMRVLIISAPANVARLDAIRADLAALADPRITTPGAARVIAERTPAVVLLSHSIHGNEPAGFEAAMQTAYQLLASEEPATVAILENVVTIINPSQNPDGHERFAAWSNAVAVAADEPAALEQAEPWSVWGRYNHYRFDLNRDLVSQSQPETRALAGMALRWNPQVVVDLHSTTAQYFFPPAALPLNANLPPSTVAWLERYGRGNAAAFDRYGWQYYVRDVFDLFYAGYWDTWPSLNGAIGMTYESDGGPELRLRKDDGTVTTFRDGIAHHYVASMATLATTASHRAQRLIDYYDFRASGMGEAAGKPFRRVVWLEAPDPGRAYRLARLLAGQNVEVTRSSSAFSSAAHPYLGSQGRSEAVRSGQGGRSGQGRSESVRVTFPAGSYVVDLAQPQARLATALLEPRASLDTAFVRAQLARYERNKVRGEDATREPYEFYDVTAWALPLTLGLDAYWTEDAPPVTGMRVAPDDSGPEGAATGRAQSAYVFPNDREGAAKLAMRLLREGFKVGWATEALRADGVTYPRGTFVLRTQRNPEALHARIAELAGPSGVAVTAVQSAFPDSGQTGVGSQSVAPLREPKVLLAAGDGVSTTTFGAFWFYLERELEHPVVPIRVSALSRVDLADYNVVILPGGSSGTLWGELGEAGAERLGGWVRAGGAVIAVGGAAGLLRREELALTTVRPLGEDDPEEEDEADRDTTVAVSARPGPPVVSPTAPAGTKPEFIPGAIFRATLDRTHWLTFGYEADHLPVFLQTSTLLRKSDKGDNPVAFVGTGLTLAGFTWPDNTERFLGGSVWAAVENVGRGRVVIFAEDPLFRGFWRAPARLVTNALLFGPRR